MGGPLSRLFTDLIIEHKIEKKIHESREWRRNFNWVRLIDDTFTNWDDSDERLKLFFDFLNSLYEPLKWTMEVENENQFHVFDISLQRTENGVETSVLIGLICFDGTLIKDFFGDFQPHS